MKKTYKVSVGKRERKGPLGKPRNMLQDNIRVDVRKIGWEVID